MRAKIQPSTGSSSIGAAALASAALLAGAMSGVLPGMAPAAGATSTLPLTQAQVRINDRIAQTALTRSLWLERRMNDLGPADIRDSGITADLFGAQVVFGGPTSLLISDPAFCPQIDLPAGPGRSGATLSTASLRRAQRAAQDAIALANVLQSVIDHAGLTSGNVRDGSIGAVKLAPGLRVVSASDSPQLRVIFSLPAPARDNSVVLSGRQLLINQRIAQVAIRRAGALGRQLGCGLPGSAFKPGGLVAQDLSPELRAP